MDLYLGQLLPVAFPFAPKGWALCNGQILQIAQNQALFALLGTTFGGDGRTTFALPDLQGRVPAHVGNGLTLGQKPGEAQHALAASELPPHQHTLSASNQPANTNVPMANSYATEAYNLYIPAAGNALMNAGVVSSVGAGGAHENKQPYTVINWIIALTGIFPSRN